PTSYTVARGPKELITDDLDGDGHLDLAVSSTGYDDGAFYVGEEKLTVLFGTGTGTFARIQSFYAPFSSDLLAAGGVRAGDVDADGDLDLMLQAASNDISFYRNEGGGMFTFPYRVGFTQGAMNPFWADFTGDGVADLAAVRHRPPLGFDSGVAVLKGASEPTTDAPLAPPSPSRASGLQLAPPWPNPVHNIARVAVTLGREQQVAAVVHDLAGRRVLTIYDGVLPAGTHRLLLDASKLSPGVYVVHAATAEGSAVRRMVVSR
ncbi:MAG TPA: FG-GAP-like repeat-containing protein, partial [Candidatus Limnocylindria bacterium]|nr:FG-GAP-like repeat-containing protein [Candidatus Limnocylindria bacterium]